jgi:16S rRNA (guanine(1405)-N(7))-methyltransferase
LGTSDESLDRVAGSILASPKYADLDPGFVRDLCQRELAKGRGPKGAAKAARSRLHQVAGAFNDAHPPYEAWLESLREAARPGDPEVLRVACRAILKGHASTRERLRILDGFHAAVLDGICPPRRMLDLGCGLHPLSVPWIPLANAAEFHAVDVWRGLAAFLAEALPLLGVRGTAEVRDLANSVPDARGDVAFLLKTLPSLERLDPAAPLRLLETVRADVLVVSFPSRTLGGRAKGLEAGYRGRFLEMVSGKAWAVREFAFPGEIVFRIAR